MLDGNPHQLGERSHPELGFELRAGVDHRYISTGALINF